MKREVLVRRIMNLIKYTGVNTQTTGGWVGEVTKPIAEKIITDIINRHVAEVIGEDEDESKATMGEILPFTIRNKQRAEMRKKAGI